MTPNYDQRKATPKNNIFFHYQNIDLLKVAGEDRSAANRK